jgi:hypothetical protein
MFCHCFILQRHTTDVIVWMLPTSMDIMDLLKELSQKTRVFDSQWNGSRERLHQTWFLVTVRNF